MTEPIVELRGQVPRLVVNVLDAVSLTGRVTRWDLVNTILQEWADLRMREAAAVMRLTTGEENK